MTGGGPDAVSTNCSAASITAVCRAGSPGASSGYPWRNGTQSARGGRTFSATSRKSTTQTVVMPRRSSSAATRHTVWLHMGHTGTSSATSTWSATSASAMAGAVSFWNRPVAVIDPITE